MTNTVTTFNHPAVWRAREGLLNDSSRLETGYTVLDDLLGGGLPSKGLVRVRSLSGIGELSVFHQVLADNPNEKLISIINCPGNIHAAWLHQYHIDAEHVRLIRPEQPKDILWSAEQCLKSEACHIVVLWINSLTPRQARRLQVAASQHNTLCLMLESQHVARCALPLTLDMRISSTPTGLHIQIDKHVGAQADVSADIGFSNTPSNKTINQILHQRSDYIASATG